MHSQILNVIKKSYLFLSEDSKSFLEMDFCDEKIKKVVFQIQKTLSPDGFQAGLFHEYLNIVGVDVIGVVKEFFNQTSSLKSINQTFIALIPLSQKLRSLNPSLISNRLVFVLFFTRLSLRL